MIDVLYFSWLRERVGVSKETVDTTAETVAELVTELKQRSDAHALAFEDMTAVRVAVDQDLTEMTTTLAGVREVAFFPPMTGG